ncbi:kelch-like protein 7 [Anopheles moucheti]|uniref:kelch-like protein 7 n=1 Tax=Anopheles moucheti TaxID=186751 RepID=UPI0022F0B77C|nr:kelch-like protein 7 [Anopheles moucheti]
MHGIEHEDCLNSRIEWMVNNKFFSDVTFIVGPAKQRIYGHKLHLVTASKFFYTLLFGDMDEMQLDEIELEDEDPEIFLTILRLIYGAKVEINYENMRDIYDHMRMYRLTIEYYKPLIDFLTDQIVDKDAAMKVFRENHHYKFQLVDELCMPYIQSNPLYHFKTIDFTQLEEERLLKIVGLQQINCTEDQLLCAIDRWENANPQSDTKEFRKLGMAVLL